MSVLSSISHLTLSNLWSTVCRCVWLWAKEPSGRQAHYNDYSLTHDRGRQKGNWCLQSFRHTASRRSRTQSTL